MLYLFLGNAIVGLFILLSIPLEDKLTSGQYALTIGFSVFLDFLPVLPYLVGRYFSKQSKLHWETLLFLGVTVGLFTQVLLPEFGVMDTAGNSLWYIPATLFFAIGFLPANLEVWRFKKA